MENEFLLSSIKRHYKETKPLFEQVPEDALFKEPVQTGRPVGELLLHMLRAMEFYPKGIVEKSWVPLPFTLGNYDSKEKILQLYEKVEQRCQAYLRTIESYDLDEEMFVDYSNSYVTKKEILLEFLEHNVGHRGQLLVYLRLLGITPTKIDFKV